MSLLAGFQQGYRGAQRASDARTRRELAERQMQIMEAEEERAARKAATEQDTLNADNVYSEYSSYGFISDDGRSIDKAKMIKGLESDDPATVATSQEFVKRAALVSGLLPPGTKDVKIQRLPNGSYVLNTTNPDDSDGVVTLDATSNPESEAAEFKTLQDLVNNLNVTFKSKILPNVNKDLFDVTLIDKYANSIDAELEGLSVEGKARLRNDAALRNILSQYEGQPGIQRGIIGGAANLEDNPEAQREFINQVGAEAPEPVSISGVNKVSDTDTGRIDSEIKQLETELQKNKGNRGKIIEIREQINRLKLQKEGKATGDMSVYDTVPLNVNLKRDIKRQEEILDTARARLERLNSKTTEGGADAALTRESTRNAKKAAEASIVKSENKIKELRSQLTPQQDPDSPTFELENQVETKKLDDVGAGIESDSTDQIVRKVNEGKVNISVANQRRIEAELAAQGINTIPDLNQIKSRRKRAIAKAAILASLNDNPTLQSKVATEMSNIIEEGTPSMSRKDRVSEEISREQLKQGWARLEKDKESNRLRADELTLAYRNADRDAEKNAIETGVGLLNASNVAFYGENGDEDNLNKATASSFININLSPYLFKASMARTIPEAQIYYMALNPVLSNIVASLAAEEEGGFKETLISFFRGDVSGDTNTPSDFDLSRVRADVTAGKLIGFYYTDAFGRRLDERIDAKDLKGFNEEVFNMVLTASQANEKLAREKAARQQAANR